MEKLHENIEIIEIKWIFWIVKRMAKVDNFRMEKEGKKSFHWWFLQIVDFLTNYVEKGIYLNYTEDNNGSL